MDHKAGKNKVIEYKVHGMDCADCALHVEREVSKIPGVNQVKVNFVTSKMTVEAGNEIPDPRQIRSAVKKAGYSIASGEHSEKDVFKISWLNSPLSGREIRRRLMEIEGINRVRLQISQNRLEIEHELESERIQNILNGMGVPAEPVNVGKRPVDSSSDVNRLPLILTIASGIFAFTGIFLQSLEIAKWWVIFFMVTAIGTGGFPIAVKGFHEARNLRLGMNFLMSVAVLGAMFIGEWTEGAMVIFLFSLAELLESYSIQRARRSLSSLMDLAPTLALVKVNGQLVEKPVDQVSVGEILVIRPGKRIPLDGTVLSGTSTVDQSQITGESIPHQKSPGDIVYAGSLNQVGALEIEVAKISRDSTLARIIHLVEAAQSRRAPMQNFVEKFARYYTPAIVAVAVLIAILPPLFFAQTFSEWFYRALVLLVISCPCALVISTPITIISALTNASRAGILIKGGAYLENFHRLQCLAFDKTGTLTYGQPVVQKIIALNGYSEQDIITIAAAIEANSEHAIARAIRHHAVKLKAEKISISDFRSITGKGASAEIYDDLVYIGNHRLFEENGWCKDDIHPLLQDLENQRYTTVLLGSKESLIGLIALSDGVREEADETIRRLYREGMKKIAVLTGDNEITARAVCRKLNISEYYAELLPEEKVNTLNRLKKKYGLVGMVGDGVNDAPALATASIGISMGVAGSDTAIETADIALMYDDLSRLVYLKKLSHRTMRIVQQNIFISLFLKLVFFLLAIPGLATLWMAVFADMGASLIVIFNGLRALGFREIEESRSDKKT